MAQLEDTYKAREGPQQNKNTTKTASHRQLFVCGHNAHRRITIKFVLFNQ